MSAIQKMSTMVRTFENLCCNDGSCTLMKAVRKNYTNFSVNEILKPDFGPLKGYDSDGTYCSESADINSSGDEVHYSDYSRSPSPEIHECVRASIPTEMITRESAAFSVFRRFRNQYDDDGYTSSDSESALDLRIARKKTPPKLTTQLPAWVFCTRYSDRPSTGRKARRRKSPNGQGHKRTRTAFSETQLHQLNLEFQKDPYLSESRRQRLADELRLSEINVKIWFQNRRAKLKKTTDPHPLAIQLQAEGLYNHKPSTE